MSKRFAQSLAISFLSVWMFFTIAQAVEEIKIASTGPGLSTLPLEIAARKGFFRDEGVDVLTITMRTNIAVNAVATRRGMLSRNTEEPSPQAYKNYTQRFTSRRPRRRGCRVSIVGRGSCVEYGNKY